MLRWILLFCLLPALPQAAPLSAEDSMGETVVLQQAAQRVISLAPHITELVYAIGAGDRLVGVSAYSDYPEAAKQIPRIGDALRIDEERVLALQPDLVIAWGSGNPIQGTRALRRHGLGVFVSELRTLDDIPAQMRALGILLDVPENAERAARKYEERLAQLRDRYRNSTSVDVFYQLAAQPLLTVNHQHLVNAVLELCGGRNLFADLPAFTPQVSIEAVLVARPQAIVFAEFDGQLLADVQTLWEQWPDLPAIRRNAVIGVNADHIHRATPRILLAAEAVCGALERVRR